MELGLLSRLPDGRFRVHRPRLLRPARGLVGIGMSVDDALRLAASMRELVQAVSSLFVTTVADHIVAQHPPDWVPTDTEIVEIAAIVERLRPLARVAVDEELGPAVDADLQSFFGDWVARTHGPAEPADLAEQLADPADALDEVVVAEGEAQPHVARGTERLAGHDRDLDLVEDSSDSSSVVVGVRPASSCRARPRRTGSSRTRPAARARDARDLAEHPRTSTAPAAVEGVAHHRDRGQVAGHGGERGRAARRSRRSTWSATASWWPPR